MYSQICNDTETNKDCLNLGKFLIIFSFLFFSKPSKLYPNPPNPIYPLLNPILNPLHSKSLSPDSGSSCGIDRELVSQPIDKIKDDPEYGTLEKSYETSYTRPVGLVAKVGKTAGFILFWTLFGFGVTQVVPKIFRAILGIPESS